MRRSADALKAPTYIEDKNSGEMRRPHHVDPKTGKALWERAIPWPTFDLPALHAQDETLIVLVDSYQLSRWDTATGKTLWEVPFTQSPAPGHARHAGDAQRPGQEHQHGAAEAVQLQHQEREGDEGGPRI